jgi:hypothetical protein
MQVVMMKSALAAAADGSELKRTYAIGDSFYALHLKLTPAYVSSLAMRDTRVRTHSPTAHAHDTTRHDM